MNGVDAKKQLAADLLKLKALEKISESLERIANFLEATTVAESLERISDVATHKHLKVHVSNEPDPLEGVQSSIKIVELNKKRRAF